MDNQGKIYFNIGRFLFGFVMLFLAIESFSLCGELEKSIPEYIGFGKFWVIIMGIVYAIAGISYLSNKGTGIMALIITLMVIIIIFSSTIRGFNSSNQVVGTLLKITSHLVIIAGSLIIASKGEMVRAFNWGRIIFGIFFIVAGILHLTHVTQDSSMLAQYADAKGLVIFTGICWILCGLSIWVNILSRFAALGAIILILLITFMINIKGGISSWGTMHQLFNNLSAIAVCFLVSTRGTWFIKRI